MVNDLLVYHHFLHARKVPMGAFRVHPTKKPSGHKLIPKGLRSPDKREQDLSYRFPISGLFRSGAQNPSKYAQNTP